MKPLRYPVIVCLLINMASARDDDAYCALRYSRLCQEKGQHVGCQYPDPGPGESCENYVQIEFSEELKNFILNYINRRRQKIAAGHERVRGGLPIPKPDIMMYVEWDRELAYLAQRLADQCRFVHDECRATVRYPYAGQTVGEVRWRRSLDSDQITAQKAIRKVLDAWWGEKRRVQPQQLTTPFRVTPKGTVWGHFSQLAIWKLRAIGCGAVRHGPPHPRLLLVCDYSHTNMLGQKTISAGPLATCPPHTARRPRSQFPLLCSTIMYPARFQEMDALYDYENEDISETSEETTTDEEEIVTTGSTDIDIYMKRTQYDRHDIKMHSFGQRKSTAPAEDNRDIMIRNQIRISNGRYHPLKSTPTTTTWVDTSEYDERKKIEEHDKHDEYFREKRPHKSDDYSVIPLRNRHLGQTNDVDAPPWRPKLYWRTSSTEYPEYETSIVKVIIPLYKNHRRVTESAPPPEVLQTIRRKYYDKENIRTSTDVNVREKAFASPVRRPLAPSLKLDKDDIEQLFKDTGFKPNWTPKV